MAANFRPHVKLNTKEQKDKPIKLKFNYGFGQEEPEDSRVRNYFPMAQAFKGYLSRFENSLNDRVRERELQIPIHIDYIQIQFHSQFDITKYYSQWNDEFGLAGVNFSKFNTEILFAITDRDKLRTFTNSISNFIAKETGEDSTAEYSTKILYIKEFKLLTTADIIQFREAGALMNFKLIDDLPLDNRAYQIIFTALQKYLRDNGIEYRFDESSNNLEVINAPEDVITTAVRNFDIVLNVTSSLATVIRPSQLNLPQRSYGFEVDAEDDLPMIGIVDTGVSNQTPLSAVLVDDHSFNLTGTDVFDDNVNHGTAVAALAALGKKAYAAKYRGSISADAKILSMKIMDQHSSYLSQKAVLDLLRAAKAKYPSLKIFVLTTCYQANKRTNEDYTAYAFELDKFSHENDCLVLICTANNQDAEVSNNSYDLNYFHTEITNLCTPAESMNNLTVGAAADCMRGIIFEGISSSKEFPTLYTRKSHIDLSLLFPKNKINKLYFKPDVIECGGDYEFGRSNSYIGVGARASMEVLSANPTESFYPQVGTSFATPLVANIAAQIQRSYPNLSSQSIKALIVNAAGLDLIRFQNSHAHLLNKTAGYGLVNEEKAILSNDNSITFLIEDEIEPEQVKIFPVKFPKYLIEEDLGKKRGILKVTATLCFSFLPVHNHQLAYCPVHMAFCFFRNQEGEDILATEENVKSLLKSDLRWSQSARHKSKPIPYTNTQKRSFPVNRQDLVNENSIFKLAVNCRINPQLLPGTETPYQRAHKFSLVVTIEETLKEENLTGQLYDEVILCNTIENISVLAVEAEATAEATSS